MNEILANFDLLARDVTEEFVRRYPETFARYGALGKTRCREDVRFHLERLSVAVDVEEPELFVDYIAWTKSVLVSRGIPASHLRDNLQVLLDVLRDRLDAAAFRAASPIIDAALDAFPHMSAEVPTTIDTTSPFAPDAEKYLELLLGGRAADAAAFIEEKLRDGNSIEDVFEHIVQPAQRELGRLWQINRITVAQEHFCTAATYRMISAAGAQLRSQSREGGRGTLVAMCPAGELHDLGLCMVAVLLEKSGWRTIYLGANVPGAAAIRLCAEQSVNVLLMSTASDTYIPAAAETIRLFKGVSRGGKVIVGGRAFERHPKLWQYVNADRYAANARECLQLLNE